MSELRRDPFTGRWVVIAEGRAERPNEHAGPPPAKTADPECPFCEGNEARTPPEVGAIRSPGSPPDGRGWLVRAIPNRFPTLGGSDPAARPTASVGEFRPGEGAHEVVIESPTHAPAMPKLGPGALKTLFHFLQERFRVLEGHPSAQTVVLFENWGPESGGTLWHPHAQLAAIPLVPPRLAAEAERFAREPHCPLEAATAAERADGTRLIAEDRWLTVTAPFGSEHPYEMRIVPREHRRSFGEATAPEIDAIAEVLPDLLRRLDSILPGVSYNWLVHGGGSSTASGFHWHAEVVPRLVRPDGFEVATDLMVNPVPPELAAARLRDAGKHVPEGRARKR